MTLQYTTIFIYKHPHLEWMLTVFAAAANVIAFCLVAGFMLFVFKFDICF